MLVDDLRAVKESILTRGWYQGAICEDIVRAARGDFFQAACLMGHVNLMTEGYIFIDCSASHSNYGAEPGSRRDNLIIHIGKLLPPGWTIAKWNDVKSRTLDDVINLIDRAIIECTNGTVDNRSQKSRGDKEPVATGTSFPH